MTGCAATCQHYRFVTDYREERQRQEDEAEEKSLGYDEERKDIPRSVNFKEWLIAHRREPHTP